MNTSVASRLAVVASAAAIVAACTSSDVTAPSATSRRISPEIGIATPGVVQACIDPASPAGVYTVTTSNAQGVQPGDVVTPSPFVINTTQPGPVCMNAITRTGTNGNVATIMMHLSAAVPGTWTFTCVDDAGGNTCLPASGVNDATAGENSFHGSTVTFTFHPQEEHGIPTPLFVIGDHEFHDIGASVMFWGAQWWKNNSMTGDVSNGVASFKGYATSADNFCGGHWTSSPGNSSNPPATLPTNVAIIVTSTVNKMGPDISGDIVEILKVHADDGYEPNPGHAGTGTVLSVACTLNGGGSSTH